ncbi:Dabb family protein [Aeromicrobium sp. P5_D10]
MIKHMVLFAFNEDVDGEQQQAILDELNELPSRYPAMQNWSCGQNISNRNTTLKMTHAFVVEFAQEQDLLDYLHSDGHEEFVTNRWRQVILHQVIVSYEYA